MSTANENSEVDIWGGIASEATPLLPQAGTSAASDSASESPDDEAPHIVMPDGEAIDTTDADALITAYERIAKMNDTVYAVTVQLKQALQSLTEGTAKTRRVAGKSRVAVVTMPDKSWDNSKLKEAYNSFPALRDQFLRIEKIAVKATEFNKTRTMTVVDNPPLETFLSMVASAENPPSGNPTIKIEK